MIFSDYTKISGDIILLNKQNSLLLLQNNLVFLLGFFPSFFLFYILAGYGLFVRVQIFLLVGERIKIAFEIYRLKNLFYSKIPSSNIPCMVFYPALAQPSVSVAALMLRSLLRTRCCHESDSSSRSQ